MLQFQIDPVSPHSVLEDCTYQLDMLAALLSGAGKHLELDDGALTGMAATLRCVSSTLQRVHDGVYRREKKSGTLLRVVE